MGSGKGFGYRGLRQRLMTITAAEVAGKQEAHRGLDT